MAINISQNYGESLHNQRRRLHLTLEALALVAGMSPATLSNYERGKKLMDGEAYIRLLFALNSIASPSPRRKRKAYPGQTGMPL